VYTKHAEAKAGIVMLLGIAALLGFLYVASGESLFSSWRYVHIRFEQGKLAPKTDDPVLIDGVRVGTVKEVTLATVFRSGADLTAREIHVHVIARLPSGQVLPVGTYAEIGESITGSVRLALIPGLSEKNISDADTEKDPIHGVEAVGLASISEKVGVLVDQLGKLTESGGGVLDEAKALLLTLRAKVDSIDAAAIGLDVKQTLGTLRRIVEGLESHIATIAENVEAATGDLKTMATKGARVMDTAEADVKDLLTTLKEVAKKLDALLDRASPRVEEFLASMTRVAGSLDALAKDFAGLLDTSEDVKSRPWILLNKPDDDQIAFENVRIASQNYAKAMQEMSGAAERLLKLSTSGNAQDPETKRLVQEALAQFRSSQDRYQRFEAALLQALEESSPKRRPNPPR
jgi:ABC-type transporter Mla subunit MlaD